jgi:glucose/arabinose dehydrogenase
MSSNGVGDCGVAARIASSLAAIVLGFWKGEVCGREGVFIGTRRRRNRNRIGWIDSGNLAVSGRENRMEVEGDVGADERVPHVSEKERGRVYRFGREGRWAVGHFWI